jgi:methylenetetrahydrofolate dehydrogenase (NADP+)/methenyltetrahydrofolate cyclohydrolase
MLIDCQKIAQKINKNTKLRVARLIKRGYHPKITVFLVGNSPQSIVYVNQKEKMAKKLGFNYEIIKLPVTISEKKLSSLILQTQNKSVVSGIIIQLPLPKKIDANKILSCLLPDKDIDCLSDINLGRLVMRRAEIMPPTVSAILAIIDNLKINLKGKKTLVIGSGLLVGRPLALELMERHSTVIVANSSTKDLTQLCKSADIIISAVGQAGLIKPNMIKKGTVVIDAGFSFVGKKSVGDADGALYKKQGIKITPTPGGVGVVTVACLLRNAVLCAENNK